MKKIMLYLLTLGMSVLTLTGCVTTNGTSQKTTNQKYVTVTEAMGVLGIKDIRMLQMNLPLGYKTSKSTDMTLNTLAGIYTGTVEVRRTGKTYEIKGSYSQLQNPNALILILKAADTNADKIITREESMVLMEKVYRENAK